MARLEEEQIEEQLSTLEGWNREGGGIVAERECGDFAGSVDLVNRILPVAEEMNHHPDLALSWATVTITITTHSEGGLTDNDFELAKRIDALG